MKWLDLGIRLALPLGLATCSILSSGAKNKAKQEHSFPSVGRSWRHVLYLLASVLLSISTQWA